MPKSLIFLMVGYLGILGFVTLFCQLQPGHGIKADEKVLHRIVKC